MHLNEEIIAKRKMPRDILITAYEQRMLSLENIILSTQKTINEYHNSVIGARIDNDRIKKQLREYMARNQSFRKKDFDDMMNRVIHYQNHSEEIMKRKLNDFFECQKSIIAKLKNSLNSLGMSDDDAGDSFMDFHEQLKELVLNLENEKEGIINSIRYYQEKQSEIIMRLKEIINVNHGNKIRKLKQIIDDLLQ